MDLATLGIAVESRPVAAAAAELDKLSASAKRAEGATNDIGRASEGASRSHSRVSAEVTKAERAQRDYDRAVRLSNGGLTEHQRRSLEAARANDNLAASIRRSEGAMGSFEQAVGTARRALGALGVALSVQQLVAYADGWSDMQSRVGAAVRNMEAAPLLMQRIVQIANASYSPLSQTVEIFSRNVTVLRDMGYGASQAADFTEALNNALILTATRGERAASVQSALSRAMAVGKLEADGLETVLVNGGAVAEALASHLGTTVNGLRAMASEGRITGSVIADALITRFDEFRSRAEEMPATIGDAFVRLGTNFSAFIGQMDQASGASGFVARNLLAVADSIDFIARASAVAGVALTGAFAPTILAGMATGMTAIGTAGASAITAITVAMAANPLGALAVAIATTITALYLFRDEIASILGIDLIDTARRAANELIGLFVGAYGAVQAVWSRLPTFMQAVGKQAWNALIEEFEKPALTINGITLIPGFDLSTFKNDLNTVEKIALDKATVAFDQGFRAEYVPAAEAAVGATRNAEDAVADLNAILGETPGAARYAGAALTKEQEKATDAFAAQIRSLTQNSEALQRQVDMFDATAGATADAELRARELARAWDIAREAGISALPQATIDAIDAAAGSVESLTNQLERLGLERGQSDAIRMLEAEASLIGMNANARKIAMAGLQAEQQLRSQNIVTTDAWGQAYVRNAQAMAATRAEIDKQTEAVEKQRQLVENVASTFLDIFTDSSFDSFFDRILKGLADISRQFADLGKQRLLDMFSGGALGYTAGQPAPGQRTVAPIGVPLAANQNSPAGISVGAVAALNDNLQQSSRSALDVAKQFQGLNERADAPVLDSFLQASGTWRGMSARDFAWCASFANAAIVQAGGKGTGSNMASSFMNWGQGTNTPKPGDIVVFRPQARGTSGHVSFFEGFDANGNVRAFGGNQSGMARTSTYGASEVRAFRTAVAGGIVDANRAMATGQSGVIASGPSMSGAASSALAGGWGGVGPKPGQGNAQLGMLGRAQQFMQSPLGMGGMNAFSAFGAGMSSGSPVSGAFSGGLGAFGMGLGPVGIAAGVVGGLLGGLFGRSRRKREERRQREEQERQQRLQAQQQLDQQLPAILELQDTLLDRASGTLTKERARIESQLKQYAQLAATAKNQGEIDRLASMQSNLDDYMTRLYDQLRLTASSVIQSMLAGRGLEPEFAKAVSAVRDQSLAIRNYLADLTAATGAGSAEVQAATAAGREQLLRMLSGAEEVTEIWTKLDALTGTASQLSTELQKLGANAEEAAVAIADHLGRGIQKMRDEFVRGIADETAEGMGLGYLPQLRALMERRETMRADATSLGANPALIDRWFGVQARNILDQAGLLDKEIAPLVQAFPELATVLGDASAKIERSLADAENDLRTAYQRVRQFADQLAAFRDDIKLDRNLSTLGPEERLLEAQKQFRETAEKAAAGDATAQGELISLSRSYLDEAKAFYTTSEAYYAIFREVDGTLKSTEAKAVAELDLAKSQYGALLDLNESVKTIPQALDALNTAMAARDLAQGQALQAYVQALNPQAAIPSYQAPGPVTGNPAPAPAPAPAPPPPAPVDNVSLWNGSGFSNYVGNWKDIYGRRIFVPSGWSDDQAFQLFVRQQDAPKSAGGGFFFNEKRFGGAIGYGFAGLTGFQTGGMIGNGIYDVDSVIARHASGGAVALAGGEFVTTARGVNAQTRPMLDFINREHRLPAIAMPVAPTMRGQDNRELVAEVRALRAEVSGVRQAVGLGAVETVGAVERGTRVAQERAMEAKRQRAAA